MDHTTGIPNCPFCPFSDADSRFVAAHIEFCHPEHGVSSEIAHDGPDDLPEDSAQDNQNPPSDEEESTEKYVDCPHGCGEIVISTELNSHLDLHMAEEIALEDSGTAQPEPQNLDADAPKFDELLEDKYAFQGKGRPATKGISQRVPLKKKNRSSSADFGTASANGVRRLGVCVSCNPC